MAARHGYDSNPEARAQLKATEQKKIAELNERAKERGAMSADEIIALILDEVQEAVTTRRDDLSLGEIAVMLVRHGAHLAALVTDSLPSDILAKAFDMQAQDEMLTEIRQMLPTVLASLAGDPPTSDQASSLEDLLGPMVKNPERYQGGPDDPTMPESKL